MIVAMTLATEAWAAVLGGLIPISAWSRSAT